MDVFVILFQKLIPLYALIALGFLAGKTLEVKRETVARLLIYIIVPAVIFYGTATVTLDAAVFSLPFVFYGLCCVLCFTFYAVGKFFWKDTTRNLLAYTSGTGNNGYFGLPLVLALFSEQAFGIAVFAGLGFLFYECTMGLLIMMRGTMGLREGLGRRARVPMIYAFLLGLAFNVSGFAFSQTYLDVFHAFRGAYTVLGMMLIGLGLSSVRHLFRDLKFVGLAFVAKFAAWPLAMFLILWLDLSFMHLYSEPVHQVMFLFSIIPLAANTVAYATEFRIHPDKAAGAVLLSTAFALFYIPLMVALVLG